ncbi:MAG TPA: YdcF family protein [Lysobacter sp.]|nr:YdcF family protein [Lysobacter sp.]
MASALRFRKTGKVAIVLAVSWSLLWSVPVASDGLRHVLEQRHPVLDEKQLPRADAIVVLGGATRYRWLDRERVDPWELRNSRLAAGARAWLSGRAPIVILSGGRGGGGESEALRMKSAIQRLGVPSTALVLEEHSLNTRDNAANTADLAREKGIQRILLVTSSVHMPRAAQLFRRTGLTVTPVPVPENAKRASWPDRWLPSARALWRSGRALKEFVALVALSVDARPLTRCATT